MCKIKATLMKFILNIVFQKFLRKKQRKAKRVLIKYWNVLGWILKYQKVVVETHKLYYMLRRIVGQKYYLALPLYGGKGWKLLLFPLFGTVPDVLLTFLHNPFLSLRLFSGLFFWKKFFPWNKSWEFIDLVFKPYNQGSKKNSHKWSLIPPVCYCLFCLF